MLIKHRACSQTDSRNNARRLAALRTAAGQHRSIALCGGHQQHVLRRNPLKPLGKSISGSPRSPSTTTSISTGDFSAPGRAARAWLLERDPGATPGRCGQAARKRRRAVLRWLTPSCAHAADNHRRAIGADQHCAWGGQPAGIVSEPCAVAVPVARACAAKTYVSALDWNRGVVPSSDPCQLLSLRISMGLPTS